MGGEWSGVAQLNIMLSYIRYQMSPFWVLWRLCCGWGRAVVGVVLWWGSYFGESHITRSFLYEIQVVHRAVQKAQK